VVNLETAITTGGTAALKQYVFRAPPAAFIALRAAGIDVATIANNHGMDYGLQGLRDTLAAAALARFPVVGAGLDDDQAVAPYRVTVKGTRLAVFGATQVLDDQVAAAWTAAPGHPGLASAKHQTRLLDAVRRVRGEVDAVVVYLHSGQERMSCPTSSQRDLTDALLRSGADVVVSSHAHVLLGSGWRGQSYVAYGLGNFAFYAAGSGPQTETGVLRLTLLGNRVQRALWLPARIRAGIPTQVTAMAAAQARQRQVALRACAGLAPAPAT